MNRKTDVVPIGDIIYIVGDKEVVEFIGRKITLNDSSVIFIKYEDSINDKLNETWKKFITKVHYYLTHLDVVITSDDRYNENKLWEYLGKKPKYVINVTEGEQ